MAKFSTIKTDKGELSLAPPRFSADVTELMEMVEEAALPAENRDPKFRMSRLVKLVRSVMMLCAVDAGHTSDEADSLISRIELNEESLVSTVSALGI